MIESKKPLSRKERLNRNILIGCVVLVFPLGVGLGMLEPDIIRGRPSLLSNNPISAIAAVILAIIWGIMVSFSAFLGHRTVDEQEAHAYREGTFYAFGLYLIGAPTWWILWRGGLLPEPDGIAIYCVTLLTCVVIWLWKKYR